jgi:hypothetical protein
MAQSRRHWRRFIDFILLGEERCGSEGGRRRKEQAEGGREGASV